MLQFSLSIKMSVFSLSRPVGAPSHFPQSISRLHIVTMHFITWKRIDPLDHVIAVHSAANRIDFPETTVTVFIHLAE